MGGSVLEAGLGWCSSLPLIFHLIELNDHPNCKGNGAACVTWKKSQEKDSQSLYKGLVNPQ